MSNALENRRQAFAVWLIPEKKQATYLSGIITYFAQEYESPVFKPHCTLISGKTADINAVKAIVAEVSRSVSKITMITADITCTDFFFRALAINLSVTSRLEQVFTGFRTAIPDNHSESLTPHISLLYKNLDESERAMLADTEVPLDRITFDALKLVRPTDREREWYAVESWQTVSEHRLRNEL